MKHNLIDYIPAISTLDSTLKEDIENLFCLVCEQMRRLEKQVISTEKRAAENENALHAVQERCWRAIRYDSLAPIVRDAEDYEKTHDVRVSIIKGRNQ